jgi:hypothetical protein
MSFDINLEKLKYDMFVIYGQCVVNKTGYDNVVHSIIPCDILNTFNSGLVYSVYNNIILSRYLSSLMNNYMLSIFPNPITTFNITYKNKNYTFGIFRGICISNFRYDEFQVQLLANSCYFLKWHFLKFLEHNNIHPIHYHIIPDINSTQYIYDTMMNIGNIGINYVNDKDNIPMVYEPIKTYY